MAIRTRNGNYKCMFCSYTDNNPSLVNDHQRTHDFELLPVTKEELNKLMMFIMTNYNDREKLISPELFKRMKERAKFRIKAPEDD